MSFYYLGHVSFCEKENRISVTCADPSFSPLRYFQSNFGDSENYQGKVLELFINCLEGNLKPTAKCNIYPILIRMDVYKKVVDSIVKHELGRSVLDLDILYGCSQNKRVYKYLAEHIGLALLQNGTYCDDKVIEGLESLADEITGYYKLKEAADESSGIVRIICAGNTSLKKGWVLLISKDKDLILAPQKYYSQGKLRDKKRKAFYLGKNNDLWDIFDGNYTDSYRHNMIRNKAMKDKIERFENLAKVHDFQFSSYPYKEYAV